MAKDANGNTQIHLFLLSEDELRIRWLMEHDRYDTAVDADEAVGAVVGGAIMNLAYIANFFLRKIPESSLVVCSRGGKVFEEIDVEQLRKKVHSDYFTQSLPNRVITITPGPAVFLGGYLENQEYDFVEDQEMATRLAIRLQQKIIRRASRHQGVLCVQSDTGDLYPLRLPAG